MTTSHNSPIFLLWSSLSFLIWYYTYLLNMFVINAFTVSIVHDSFATYWTTWTHTICLKTESLTAVAATSATGIPKLATGASIKLVCTFILLLLCVTFCKPFMYTFSKLYTNVSAHNKVVVETQPILSFITYWYQAVIRGVFGKFRDFCYNLNSNRNWQTRKTPLKYLIIF